MFDLLPPSPRTSAPYRLLAPMPDAGLFSLGENGLHGYESGHAVPLAAPLRARLLDRGDVGETLHVADRSGEPWRLRRFGANGGSAMWRFQSLEHSRCRLMERLRIALAPRLAAQVLHELRNPMNAMSLHADLLARTVPKAEDPVQRARAEASVQVIKTRLADLNQRQGTMVALWLALAQADAAPAPTLAAVLENSLHLMRGLYSLHDVVLRAEDLDRITAGPDRLTTQHLHLVLIALLTAACESVARLGSTREVLLQVRNLPDGATAIELGPVADSDDLMHALGATAHNGTLAALSLLLESEGIELSTGDAGAGHIRLTIPAPTPSDSDAHRTA